jgi:putative two-component system response regulator
VFDALTTQRPYKEAMPVEVAREYLVAKRSIEFDPACIDAFLSRWSEVMEICLPRHQATPPLAPATASIAHELPKRIAASGQSKAG